MKKVRKKVIEGFPMYLSRTLTGLSSYLWENGFHEPCFMWLLRKEAKGKVAVDIGANIGYSTLSLCKKVNKVIAIEPDRRTRRILKLNIGLNNFQHKTIVCNFAISDEIGEKNFYLSKYPNLSAFNKNKKYRVQKKKVKTKNIDALKIVPNFIKMDIEGHEVEVINGGMQSLIKTNFCKILLEVHPQFYNKDRDFSKTIRELFKIGFYIKFIVSAGVANPLPIKKRGYKPFKVFKCGRFTRGIYKDIKMDDAVDFSTKMYESTKSNRKNKIVRAIMLEKSN